MTRTIFLKIDYILGGIILLILLSPWIIPADHVFPYQFKVVLYATIFSSLLLLSKLIQNKEWRFTIGKRNFIVLVYFSYLILRTWMEDLDRENLLRLISLLFLYLYFRLCSLKQLWIFVSVLPIVCIPQIIYSMYNQAVYYEWDEKVVRIFGSFFNTGIWGGFCSIMLLIGICCVTSKSLPRWFKVIHYIMILLWAFFVWKSDSRAAWLAVSGGVICWFCSCSYFVKRKKLAIIFLCFTLYVPLLYYLYIYKQASADGRLLIWGTCMDMWNNKFLWGCGVGNFCHSYMDLQTRFLSSLPVDMKYLVDETRHAFNEYLQISVEQGCIGLLFLVILVKVLFFSNQNKKYLSIEKDAQTTIRCLFIALGIWACFSYPFYHNQIRVICVLFLALNTTILDDKKALKVTFSKKCRRSCLILLCILLFNSCYQCLFYHRTCKRWNVALLKSDIKEMGSLYPLLRNTPYYLYSYGTMLNRFHSGQAISILQEAYMANASYHTLMELGKAYCIQEDFLNAEKVWYQASAMIPHKFMPYYCLMQMYKDKGESIKAEEMANLILNKPIKIRSARLNEICDEAERMLSK